MDSGVLKLLPTEECSSNTLRNLLIKSDLYSIVYTYMPYNRKQLKLVFNSVCNSEVRVLV